MQITSRPCYLCKKSNNPIIASESVEHRFGRPLMPEGVYNFARCRGCSTLYVDSDVSDSYLSDFYAHETVESVREIGTDHAQTVMSRLPEFQRHWSHMSAIRPPTAGDRLLDVGCQTGEFGAVAQMDGVEPYGIELSKSYAEVCQQRWGSGSQVHCSTLAEAPFHSEEFQYISAFETLEHICDPIAALGRLRSWLTADGILALSVPSSDYFHFKFWLLRKSPFASLARMLWVRRSTPDQSQVLPHTHIYNFSHTSVRLLLTQAGFEPVLVRVTGWHGRARKLLDRSGRLLELASGARIGFAPSLFAIARPVSASGSPVRRFM